MRKAKLQARGGVTPAKPAAAGNKSGTSHATRQEPPYPDSDNDADYHPARQASPPVTCIRVSHPLIATCERIVDRCRSGERVADFFREDLRGSRFECVDLSGSQFRATDLTGAQFRGVELVDVDIRGEIVNLMINGVDIGPLVDAELDRRYPDRAKMRPTDPAGFREAWDVVERLWAETVGRARRLDPELLHQSVDGEWSFTETLRHLVFATDSWIRRAILGDPSPWDPLDLPWDEMPDTPGVPRDRDARPSLDAVLELRRDRMSTVREVLGGLTDESLAGHTDPVEGPGWPKARSYPVRECLLCILNEEWEHRLYAERDISILEARTS